MSGFLVLKTSIIRNGMADYLTPMVNIYVYVYGYVCVCMYVYSMCWHVCECVHAYGFVHG